MLIPANLHGVIF